MRFEHFSLAAVLLLACEEKPAGPVPERFASVKKSVKPVSSSFCEKSYPASGEGSRPFVPAPLRPLGPAAPKGAAGWKWLNLWATWCGPCVEEMGVLNRWHQAFATDGLPVSFELLSVDETEAEPKLQQWLSKDLPGPITWLKSPDDLPALLDGLGLDRNTAIPVHVLIDGKGMLRCVRVGAIHEQNYGAVKDLISAG